MSTSQPRHELCICNATPVRYFALVGQFDLLVQLLGGRVKVPRTVLDPDEDPDVVPAQASLLSEIGQSERFWVVRATQADELEGWSRLRALRLRTDIEIVDLEPEELQNFGVLASRAFADSLGLVAALGPGEAAVIAIAETREWDAIVDDAGGRKALQHRAPSVGVYTSRDLLRIAVAQGLRTSDEGEHIYLDMKAKGYRGPAGLWT